MQVAVLPRTTILVLCFSLPLIFISGAANAAFLQVIHNFSGGKDGATPIGGLVEGADGSLYGTTSAGGSADLGTIFKIAPDGTKTILHNFVGGKDGGDPESTLTIDGSGNIYGSTHIGGGKPNLGTVFVLPASGKLKVLHSFHGGAKDGANPVGRLLIGKDGSIYGATKAGGASDGGAVVKIDPTGVETVLYFVSSFAGGTPDGGLVADSNGNLYGTTIFGGISGCQLGCGTLYRVAPDGTGTILYQFTGGSDGGEPRGELAMDSDGNLYGTTSVGGESPGGACLYGCGVVFEFSADGKETVLHEFGFRNGSNPSSGVLIDRKGNLFGTTVSGGSTDSGVVFEVTKHGKTTKVLYNLAEGLGSFPLSSLIADDAGNFLGTASKGGNFGDGSIFRVIP